MEDHRRTVRFGSIRGVNIYVHYSWLVITSLILLSFWGQLEANHPSLGSGRMFVYSLIGTALFFLSVLGHEVSHALMALQRGIEVKGITLYLFGGATEADASSRSAEDELAVAIVGPVTSLLFAVALGVAALASGSQDEPFPALLGYLAAINVLLAAFNMAPGLPLDGGRVFRSLVWRATGDFTKATRWATGAGIGIGYLLMSVGLLSLWQGNFGGLWLTAIGWIITQSARQTGAQEGLRSAFKDLVAADIMSSPVISIPAEAPLADVVRHYFATHEPTVFPVVDEGEVCGLLSISALRAIPKTEIWDKTAREAAVGRPPALIATRRTPMMEIVTALSGGSKAGARALVVEDGQLVGIISPTDILRRFEIADLMEPALAEELRRERR